MKNTSVKVGLSDLIPSDDVLAQCIHCGMCLSTCPTYELTKLERSSPRGRIMMIKSVARGDAAISLLFAEEMNFCLDCQACETACPAGVKYGIMVEAARVEVDASGVSSPFGTFIKKISLRNIVASARWLKFAARLLYYYQNSFIRKVIHKTKILNLISKNLVEIDKLAPAVSKTFSDKMIGERTPPAGELKFKTAFLSGCLMNVMFAEINKDTVELLSLLGCEVITPKDQVCCGSLHAHNGDFKTAKELAKKNIDIFLRHGYDLLVSNSAGCGAFMKEYQYILKDDPAYALKAEEFSSKVKDISEFLYDNSIEFPAITSNEIITYHDACHLVHTQKIINQPREVLNGITGIKIKNLEESTWCCGSAGIYNVTHYEDSMKILERKMKNIRATGAQTVLTGNPGCISQMQYGAEKFNVPIKVMHPVTFLKNLLTQKS